MTLPEFLIKRVPKHSNIKQIRQLLDNNNLHTVCESAKCPNIGECFSQKTLTFMILGNICTRNCTFCGVSSGQPKTPDPNEPQEITTAVKTLGLDYVVVTSVTRDDLPDGGATQFAAVIKALKPLPVEVLIPDFQGQLAALKCVIDAGPIVLNHNIETIPRLYQKVRPQANFERSINILKHAKQLKSDICTKTGFMVGLGEFKEEVFLLLETLKSVGCNIVTIGQYLAPSNQQPNVTRYVTPQEFKEYEEYGQTLGLIVKAGPFVRSSYQAKDIHEKV